MKKGILSLLVQIVTAMPIISFSAQKLSREYVYVRAPHWRGLSVLLSALPRISQTTWYEYSFRMILQSWSKKPRQLQVTLCPSRRFQYSMTRLFSNHSSRCHTVKIVVIFNRGERIL